MIVTAVCLFVSKDIAKLISILLLYDSILKLPKLGRASQNADGTGSKCRNVILFAPEVEHSVTISRTINS